MHVLPEGPDVSPLDGPDGEGSVVAAPEESVTSPLDPSPVFDEVFEEVFDGALDEVPVPPLAPVVPGNVELGLPVAPVDAVPPVAPADELVAVGPVVALVPVGLLPPVVEFAELDALGPVSEVLSPPHAPSANATLRAKTLGGSRVTLVEKRGCMSDKVSEQRPCDSSLGDCTMTSALDWRLCLQTFTQRAMMRRESRQQ